MSRLETIEMLLCDGNLVGVLQNATEGFFRFYSFEMSPAGDFSFLPKPLRRFRTIPAGIDKEPVPC